ncbi:AAA family ATPase [Flavobacterium oreochromis]|uniref:AAA family ATPase n=1 Tax=Flavobacterium oreochromis TaxID=2906078 RepID=UPI00385FB51C
MERIIRMKNVENLNNVLLQVKQVFVGKNEIIDLLGIALVARENAFLFGPPGTAKSAIVRELSNRISGGKNFEYLLTRFTEPNEIFGPFDIRKLKEGELMTNTEGMLPEASVVFLDEIFNANSAILNSLLMALNEKIFKRGKETKKLPALMFVGASNALPEDEALAALLDRFLIRVKCDYVNPDLLLEVLLAGWNQQNQNVSEKVTISVDTIQELQALCKQVDLTVIRQAFIEVIHVLRNTGIKVSDRRAVKLQNLIAASAVLCGRDKAIISDLWVLKFIWDNEEQIELLETIVKETLEKNKNESETLINHPQAFQNHIANAEELMKDLVALKQKWESKTVNLNEQSVLKDKLRYLQTRCDWVKNEEQKEYLLNEVNSIWKLVLEN